MDAITLDSAKHLASDGHMGVPEVALTDTGPFGEWLAQRWTEVGCKYAVDPLAAWAHLPQLSPERCRWGDAVLTHLKRAALQIRREVHNHLVYTCMLGSGLFIVVSSIPAGQLDTVMMQPAFALFFMSLVQGVAAQRVFGANERFVSWREAGVGMNTIVYFLGKDLASLVEIYFGAAVFSTVYWPLSGLQSSQHTVFWCSFAFNYAVWGLGFIWSIMFEPSAAQIITVVTSFIAFLLCGVQPRFAELLASSHGFMLRLMALSPVRWAWAFLLMDHVDPQSRRGSEFDNAMIRDLAGGTLDEYGMPLKYMYGNVPVLGCQNCPTMTLEDKWLGCTRFGQASRNTCSESPGRPPNGLVCTLKHLFLLGIYYRSVALICLIVISRRRAKGGSSMEVWARLGQKLFHIFLIALTQFQLGMLVNTSANL